MTIHPQAMNKLERYDWPGNIRELQHTIEKAVILAEKSVIRATDLFIRPGKTVSFTEAPNLGKWNGRPSKQPSPKTTGT